MWERSEEKRERNFFPSITRNILSEQRINEKEKRDNDKELSTVAIQISRAFGVGRLGGSIGQRDKGMEGSYQNRIPAPERREGREEREEEEGGKGG